MHARLFALVTRADPVRAVWLPTLLSLLSFGCGKPTAGEACANTQQAGGGQCAKGLVCFSASEGEPTCMTKSEAHQKCGMTDDCRIGGSCAYDPGVGNCVAMAEADCRKSDDCRERGRCSLQHKACVIAKDADCAQAKVCREQGLCKAVPDSAAGKCVKGS